MPCMFMNVGLAVCKKYRLNSYVVKVRINYNYTVRINYNYTVRINYNYTVRELLLISSDYTEGADFSLSQQYCSRCKSVTAVLL
jgi:hypothetical protein